MTSSSSLYGSTSTQNSSSTNSTSLYGDAGTPIPDSSGNVIVRGTLTVNGCAILTNCSSFSFLPLNATSIGIGASATSISIGAGSGTTTINNQLATANYAFPIADGTANQVLITDGAGNLSFAQNLDTTYNIDASATSGGTNFNLQGSDATTDTIKFANGTGVTVSRTSANEITFTNTGVVDPYDIDATATTGGANLNLNNALGTDTVKFASGTGVTVSQSSATQIGIAIGQDVATTANVTFADITATDDLTVQGNNVNLAQATTIGYSENNNRVNRPSIQSTTGNTSGFRVTAPNATTSAGSNLSVFGSNDIDNGEFLNLRATGSTTAPFSIRTGKYTAGVLGASGQEINFVDNVTTYASVNPSGPTVGTDLTTKTYVDAAVAGSVTSITGTANQVIASSSTGAITLSLPQSIATTSNVTFADVIVGDDLTVQGNNVNLAQTTIIGYSENNDRTNRPQVQSTTGNISGLRVLAPNATTSAQSNLSVFSTSDNLNGEFLALRASGSTSAPFSIRTGLYTAGVLSASNESVNFTDGSGTAHASVNPAGPTVGTDLTTKTYVDGLPAGGVTSVTGGTHVSASPTTGAVVVTTDATDANTVSTIVARDASGNFSAGTITATLSGTATQVSNSLTAGTHLSGGPFNGSAAVTLTTDATDANTASTIVARDASGNFSAGAGTFTTVVTPAIQNTAGAVTITGGSPAPSILTIDDTQTTLALDGGAGYGNSTLTTAYNALTWAHTAGVLDTGSVNGTWSLGLDGKTYFPNYNLPYVSGAVNTVLTNDGSGNVTWALPGGGGSTFGNITVGVDTDNTIGTTSGNLILDSASGILQLADANLSSTVAQTWTVVDNTASALSIGATGKADILKIVSTDGAEGVTMSGTLGVTGNTTLTGSLSGDNPNLNRLIRTNNGTGSNAVFELSRNRADAARATDGGSWLGFAYVGTDNTQTTAVQNVIQSRYQGVAGNHQLRFMQGQGDYAALTLMGQVQRGNTFFNTTAGVANLFLSDTIARLGGTTTNIANSANTTNYATFAASSIALNNPTTITGAGLSTITRTTVGTPTVVESRPSMNIQLIRSDQAGPTSGDGTGFRARTGGSNGTIYTMSDMSSTYSSTGDYIWALGLANGDQTGATFDSLQTIRSKISETIIAAGTPSATPGASTVSTVATFAPTSTTLASSGTTYAQFATGSASITNSGRTTISRTTPGTGLLLTQQTAASGPADGESTDFRLGVAGTSTSSNFGRFDGIYRSSGDHEIGLSVSDDSFTADTDRIYIGSRASTKLQATPSGGGSVSTIVTVTDTNITMARPVVFPSYTAAAANAITGAVGWQIAITDSASGSNPNGMMAFWDTTNARWSYIHDNSAV